MEKWPNFFIVGAPKTGTFSFYEYLKNIPGIYMSPKKEPNYFSAFTIKEDNPINPIRNKKKYLKLFKKAKNEKIIGEASPRYLSDPKAPELIYKVSPDALILIILRDPVERVFSHYLHHRHRSKSSFREQFLIETKGIGDDKNLKPRIIDVEPYTENVKRYFKIFSKNQVKILIYEEWISHPKETVEEILKFLKLDTSLDEFEPKVYNPFLIPRNSLIEFFLNSNILKKVIANLIPYSIKKALLDKVYFKKGSKPEMFQDDRDFLKNFYKDDVEKLKILLERNFQWKNFS